MHSIAAIPAIVETGTAHAKTQKKRRRLTFRPADKEAKNACSQLASLFDPFQPANPIGTGIVSYKTRSKEKFCVIFGPTLLACPENCDLPVNRPTRGDNP
jgi:hypothetical protein